EDGRLHSTVHQRLGRPQKELVERVLVWGEDGEALASPSRAAPLLAQAGHCPGEADRDCTVQEPDVDSELERVGGGDAEQVAFDEASLDVAPLRRRVAGSIRGEANRQVGSDALGREAGAELRRLSR